MTKPTLVFDMDGVLVDVTESNRETIAQTVQHFTGETISHERQRRRETQPLQRRTMTNPQGSPLPRTLLRPLCARPTGTECGVLNRGPISQNSAPQRLSGEKEVLRETSVSPS